MHKHLTSDELYARLDANFDLRTATHERMMGTSGDPMHPALHPLSLEWAEAAALYASLADDAEAIYLELARREQSRTAALTREAVHA